MPCALSPAARPRPRLGGPGRPRGGPHRARRRRHPRADADDPHHRDDPREARDDDAPVREVDPRRAHALGTHPGSRGAARLRGRPGDRLGARQGRSVRLSRRGSGRGDEPPGRVRLRHAHVGRRVRERGLQQREAGRGQLVQARPLSPGREPRNPADRRDPADSRLVAERRVVGRRALRGGRDRLRADLRRAPLRPPGRDGRALPAHRPLPRHRPDGRARHRRDRGQRLGAEVPREADRGLPEPRARRARGVRRRGPLRPLPLAPHPQRQPRHLRRRAPRVRGRPRGRGDLRGRRRGPAVGDPSAPRVLPLLERQVPPPRGTGERRLRQADDRRGALGLRGPDELLRRGPRRPVRPLDRGGLPRQPRLRRPDRLQSREDVATAPGHRDLVARSSTSRAARGSARGEERTSTRRGASSGWRPTRRSGRSRTARGRSTTSASGSTAGARTARSPSSRTPSARSTRP